MMMKRGGSKKRKGVPQMTEGFKTGCVRIGGYVKVYREQKVNEDRGGSLFYCGQ